MATTMKIYTVLAVVESNRPGVPNHEIRLGADNVVYCTCYSYKFSRNPPPHATCKHLEVFKANTQLTWTGSAIRLTPRESEPERTVPVVSSEPTEAHRATARTIVHAIIGDVLDAKGVNANGTKLIQLGAIEMVAKALAEEGAR